MTKSEYAQERKDPRWQRKRLEIMKRDDFECVDCGSKDKTLNVHHAYYISGRKPWHYPNWSLSTLCWECHKERHQTFEDDPEFNEMTNDEQCQEEPWETYIQWLNSACLDDGLGEQHWDEMVTLSRILKAAHQVSREKCWHIPAVLQMALERIESELEQ